MSIKFLSVDEDAWVEQTERPRRYQIIRRSEGVFDWHLIHGILAVASGQCSTFDEAASACEQNAAERLKRRRERKASE